MKKKVNMEVWREEKRFELQCSSPYDKYIKFVFQWNKNYNHGETASGIGIPR